VHPRLREDRLAVPAIADLPVGAAAAVKRLFFASLESLGFFGSDMNLPMTHTAKGGEIFFRIASQ
jgi:hypothetical protein